ncbi:MAG: hypothetical protein CSYNP_01584 [Syntrophus sp. SKADARSKE-3]|nr:hypothetical protein [Syntrophus sp. SKADARSKE-3]
MNTWPALPDPNWPSIKGKTLVPTLSMPTDSPYRQIRKRWTGAGKTFEFGWDADVALTRDQWLTLEKFFYDNQADAFYWTDPRTSITYLVTFDMEDIEEESPYPGYFTTNIKLRLVGTMAITGPTMTTTTTTTTTTV